MIRKGGGYQFVTFFESLLSRKSFMENFEKPEIKKQGIFVLYGRTRRAKFWLVLFGLVTYRIFIADKVL